MIEWIVVGLSAFIGFYILRMIELERRETVKELEMEAIE